MTRVLHVVEATVGGIRAHVLQLLRGLPNHGVECEVASPRVRVGQEATDTGFFEDASTLGVRLHPVAMRREINPFHDASSFLKLIGLVRRGRYDIVHGHSAKGGFLARAVGTLLGLPTVYTPNGFHFLGLPPGPKRATFESLEKLAGRFTSRMIVVSPGEESEVLRHRIVAADKLTMIPNGVAYREQPSRAEVRKEVRRRLGLDNDSWVVVVVARLSAQKDPGTFIRGFELFAEGADRPIDALWCGDGPLRAEAEDLANRMQPGHRIRFLGHRTDISDILIASDAFALTSRYEGLPYALLEAMAHRVPVVATDAVGNRDLITANETGLLIPQGAPDALAAALRRLITDLALCERLAANASALVSARYSEDSMVAATAAVYRDLLVRGPRAR